MINIVYYIQQLLPSSFINLDVVKSYLKVILSPISYVGSLFTDYQDTVTYKLSKNSQICYLESVLNDALDNSQRRIFITDANSIDMLIAYDYQDVEKRIIVADESDFEDYKVITYPSQIIGGNLHKFIVNVPTSLTSNEPQLRALTNLYKFAGKQYFIVYF